MSQVSNTSSPSEPAEFAVEYSPPHSSQSSQHNEQDQQDQPQITPPAAQPQVVITISSNHGTPSSPSASPIIKRRRTNTRPNTEQKLVISHDDDDNACSICLSAWTNAGPHQICCMPCGHLFGFSCIKQWLQSQGKNRRHPCPTCKKPARVKDLRYLFGVPTSLGVADASENQRLRKELKKERMEHELTRAQLADAKRQASLHRRAAKDLEKQLTKLNPKTRTFGETGSDLANNGRNTNTAVEVKLVTSRKTAGGSLAVACDPEGWIIYTESGNTNRANTRIVRASLNRITTASYAPDSLEKRVNAMTICTEQQSAQYRYVAVASVDRRVRLLNRDLQTAVEFPLQGIPVSITWVSKKPYYVPCGLLGGEIVCYDIRNTFAPIFNTKVDGTGARAVHSLIDIGGTTLGASPGAIFSIDFEGSMTQLHKMDENFQGSTICGISACDNLLAVLQRDTNRQGWISVYEGIERNQGKLKFGSTISEPITGFLQDQPFAQAALVTGERDLRDSVVLCADTKVTERVRAWRFGRNKEAALGWTQLAIGSSDDNSLGNVRHVRSMRTPKAACINGVERDYRGIFACAADDVIKVYASGNHQ